MGSLGNSWRLVKLSFGVLRADKELLIFPVLSFFVSSLVLAAIILISLPTFMHTGPNNTSSVSSVADYAFYFFTYLALYFVAVFFNSAMIAIVYERLKGGNYSFSDGLRVASKHLPAIFLWSLIAATVGIILRFIAEKSGLFGKIFSFLADLAWSLLTIFVAPVLIIEDKSPLEAIKRSGEIFKKTWGENFIGQFSLGTIFLLLGLAGVVPLIIGFLIGISVGLAVLFLVVIYWIALAILSSALTQIFTTVLYYYAATGQIPSGFDEQLVKGAFTPKKSHGSLQPV